MSIQLAGESNGKGFYLYDEKRKARPAPEIKDMIKSSQAEAGIMVNGKVSVLPNTRPVALVFQLIYYVDRSAYL